MSTLRIGGLDTRTLRTEIHRHETPDGVLTWIVPVVRIPEGAPLYGRPRNFELDGEPLSPREGRALKLRHEILD